MTKLRAFWNNEDGATAMEYAIIGASISIVIVASVTKIGTKLILYFSSVSTGLS